MRVPLSWLREYIDINVTPEELAKRLTLAGQEVEHMVTIGEEWENIFTGVVARLEQHPNADRLFLATVEHGVDKSIKVVTGAPNIIEGQKVLIGLVGSRYIDQHSTPPKWATLKPAKIRGVETEGMVMSEAELGLSLEHEGIIVLDPETPLGLPAREVLGDVVLQIDVTPNNGRVLSMIGVAREVKAIFGGEVRYPSTEWVAEGPPADGLLKVEIEDPDLCARYSGAVIQGIKLGQSPGWMQKRLTLAGMRPINNIVDITNYVMLEMGQPLHAFDYDAVAEHTIVVRRARPGERLETLDHVVRELDPKMLAICDVERPVALAGVMGGAESEIGEGSRNVLLESAHFDPLNIRRTARLLKLPSEASYRFERYVDPNLTVPAMKRAAELMRRLAGGTIAQGYADNYPRPPKPVRIHFYTSEVDRLLGIATEEERKKGIHRPAPSEIASILRRLDFEVDVPPNADTIGADTTMLVDVPSYRNDVTLPCDLVEEVARIIGYDLIPETLIDGTLPPQEVNVELEVEATVRDLMVACGMDEIIAYSVAHSEALEKLASLESRVQSPESKVGSEDSGLWTRDFGLSYTSWDTSRPLVTILNPMSSKQDVMRPTLLPNMLDTLRQNLKALPDTPIRIFELGKVYLTPTPEEIEKRRARMAAEREKYPRMQAWEPVPGEELMPVEHRRLLGIMSGPREPRSRFYPEADRAARLDFFDAKGVVEELLRHLHITGVEYVRADAPLFHSGRAAMLRANGIELGILGELHPAAVEAWEIPEERACVFDLSLEALMQAIPERHRYAQIGVYADRQDMAFLVSTDTSAVAITSMIKQTGGSSVSEVTLFDIYTGAPIPEGYKSLAFGVTFSSPEKPLTEEEIARLRKRIEGRLERELGAKLRT
jgi:phenylalanyl-tRNA synthetase beta chain